MCRLSASQTRGPGIRLACLLTGRDLARGGPTAGRVLGVNALCLRASKLCMLWQIKNTAIARYRGTSTGDLVVVSIAHA